jgi:PilZ domain-containing protein
MAPEGMRRSARVPKELAILLTGSDMDGRVFSERTKTVVLSRHGAGIISEYKLSAEQELIIRCVDSNKEAEVRVVGQIGAQPNSYTYGVAFVDPHLDFWGVEFPPLSEFDKQASSVWLECSNCKRHEKVVHSDLEADVYAINDGLVRYCKKCGSSTVWKQVTGDFDHEPEPVILASKTVAPTAPPGTAVGVMELPEPAAAPPKPAAAVENRRKHRRTKVSFTACIRRVGSDEKDIVTCEDMSRGGLRFKSKKQYYEQTMIEVAVPYSPGAQTIFVPGKIVYVQELPEQKLFRCGVAYTRSS